MISRWFGCVITAALALTLNSRAAEPIDPRLSVGDGAPSGPPADVQKRLNLYKDAGIDLLRIDIAWRDLEPSKGVWRDPPRTDFLLLAKKNGFFFKANIGAIDAPPGWFFQEHPEAQLINQAGLKSNNVISYWYPGLRDLLQEKDDHLFAMLSKAGLWDSIKYVIVPIGPAGEPLYPVPWTTTEPTAPMHFWFYDSNARADFPKKMQEKYISLQTANRTWGTSYAEWKEVRIPEPGSKPGKIWLDVLLWYRDTKRDIVTWQLAHYNELISKYAISGNRPRLVLLVPGTHLTRSEMDAAVVSGDGNDVVKMMADSEFLVEAAHKAGAWLQYTGLPNMPELEHLEAYIRRQNYEIPLWGENSGNLGDPQDLDNEVFSNRLFGQEYIGSNLFQSDNVSPTPKFLQLRKSHKWLQDVWANRKEPELVFHHLPIEQGTCVYPAQDKEIHLCMQDDANLVFRSAGRVIWSSGSSHPESHYCSEAEAPESTCNAEFQTDGNFVVRRGKEVLWKSATQNRGKEIVISAHAPYLKIVDDKGKVIWDAN